MADKVIPIRLSHSTLQTFHRCERLFQLEKLLATDTVREESADLSFGSGFDAGVAEYFVSQDKDKALYAAWMAYWPEIETEKKNVDILTSAMIAAFPAMDNMLRDYEVASFNGKLGTQLSFRVNINENYYFVGYADVVLRNRWTGVYSVMDAKSTGLQLHDLNPLYQNSEQALGYSILLDQAVGEEQNSYEVCYFVAQVPKSPHNIVIHPLVYEKTLLDRLNWCLALGSDIRRLELAEEIGFYPRRGGSCLKYNRPCRQFGVCTLSSMDVPRIREEDTTEYDFVFELDELINSLLERINR